MLNETYAFVAGSSGGIRAIGKQFRKSEESSFYVADDEKSICIDDLLKESTDKSLGVEFFLCLLGELSSVMTEETSEVDNFNIAENSTEQQLLQLERDLDSTMNNLRRKLMIIRLLGLMSEDEKLQEKVLESSSRLIQFLSLTFQRCAAMAKKRQNATTEEDLDIGMAERQSLQTALTLLNHVVLQPNVPNEHWEHLKDSLEDLKILSELYEEEATKKLAGKLHELIAVNVQIIQHHSDMKSKAQDILAKTQEAKGKMAEIREFTQKAVEEKIQNETFEDCLSHLEDKEVPIKGHGLIALTALVAKKDEKTMENIEQVFKIFQDNLNDADTYIYLQAIKGLSVCSFHKPDIVINR